MYSREERMKAIHLYLKYDYCIAGVIRELGYPNYRTLKKWYAEYQKESISGIEIYPCKMKARFTDEEISTAVTYYLERGKNYSRTIRALGYPSRPTLRKWVTGTRPEEIKIHKSGVKYSQDDKLEAVSDFCFRKGSALVVADKHKVNRGTLYKWKNELATEELNVLTRKGNDTVKEKLEEEVEILQKQVFKLQMEKDLLEGAAELIKKDPGISLKNLTNKEKTLLTDALRVKYPLKTLLISLELKRSTYYYQMTLKDVGCKYDELKEKITEGFDANYKCYGYRRIHALLNAEGNRESEKVVRRLMKEANLVAISKKKRKYTSYKGEISVAPKNTIQRDFSANKPNSKWLTDITEFKLPAGKVYLSPIIDCFDGMIVEWCISNHPTSELTNTMLTGAINTLEEGENPTVHSDRGSHYRWPEWIRLMEEAKLTRSMSKKGCSPDNAACEGFFGRVKNEMFYNRSWTNISIDSFIGILDRYLNWYNHDRIKMSLGGKSIVAYRKSLGIV